MGKERGGQQDKFTKRLPKFPTIKDGVRLDAKEMKNAIERIQVLEAYLDEVGVFVCVCVCMCGFVDVKRWCEA
jgi:hypothetical protein